MPKSIRNILVTLTILSTGGALGAETLNLKPSIFDYPLLANEDIEKLEWVYRAEEVLRLEHNEMGRQYREGIITEAQWKEYLSLSFDEKSKLLGNEKSKLRDAVGYSIATSSKEFQKKESDEKELFKKSTRWDVTTEKILNKNLASAAVEDFTTYTEVDPGTRIAVTATKVSVTALDDAEDARVYSDKGASHFNGNYEQLITVFVNSSTVNGLANLVWGVSNTTGDEVTAFGANGNWVRMYDENGTNGSLTLREMDGGAAYDDGTGLTLSLNTPYYLKCKRDEAVGTYGTVYVYIYSDSGRTTLVDTLSIAVHSSTKDYRYVYAHGGWGSNAGVYSWTGYTENLDLQETTPVTEVATPQEIIAY